MRKLIIPVILFIMLAVGVCAFSFLDGFSGTTLNQTYYTNKSTQNISYISVSGGTANLYGNYTLGVQRNQGVWFSSKNYINITSNGELIFTLTEVTRASTSANFYGGLVPLGWAGAIGGVTIERSATSWKIIDLSTATQSGAAITADTSPHIIKIVAIRSGVDTIFNVYYDGILHTTITQTGIIQNLYANFTFASSATAYSLYSVDNVFFTDNTTDTSEINLPVGSWVGLGNDNLCASGYAEYSKCALKPGGRSCLINAECLSGECVATKCNSPGAWDSIDNFVSLSFGADSSSLMFISILIIVALTLGIILASGGSLAGVIAGAGVLFMTTIFFLIVGWLPAFFVIGLVLLIILVVVLLIVLRG